jgi:hypothetical protein
VPMSWDTAPTMKRFPAISILTVLALLATGCAESSPIDLSAPTGPTGPAGTDIVVVVQPPSATTGVNGIVAFNASVTGTADLGVTWSVQEGPSGGAVTSSGVYTAPATPGTYHVVVASHADPSKAQIAPVTVTAAPATAVSVVPSAVTLDACRTVAFAASVSTGGGVTWSVREGAAGGSITASGAYTAPSAPGTYHVVATSNGAGASASEAIVTVGPEKVLSVAVAPGSATVAANGALAFSATVTTSCGTFAAQ